MKYGLSDDVLEKIILVFGKYQQIDEAILYGSRAKNTQKKGSDIDIALKGLDINLEIINKVTNDLEALPTPYTFDLAIFHKIDNQDLLEHIERVGKVLYKK